MYIKYIIINSTLNIFYTFYLKTNVNHGGKNAKGITYITK